MTLCSAKATLSPPKHTSQAMRKSPGSPSSHTRVWADSQLLKMLSSRNASIAAACIHSWETNAQGNAFPCSHVTPRVTSTFWKTRFLPPLQNCALQYIPLAHYKGKSQLALLDLLHLGCSVHQFAEQGCLVLQSEWFMVSHVLMRYIIHVVLVPMNISSWDKRAYRGANWCLAVF